MKLMMKFIIIFLSILYSQITISKCNPESYKLDDFSGIYPRMDISVACKVKVGDLIDYCNGEACGYLAYPKAIRSVKLHAKPDSKSKVVGEIKRCDVIKNFTLKSLFRKFGEAEALADIPGWDLKKGDKVKIAWSQEGHSFGCVNKNPVIFDTSCFLHKTMSQLEYWVSHTASNGRAGYSKVERDIFYVKYSGSNERCPEDVKF